MESASRRYYYPLRNPDNPKDITLVEITEEQYRALYPEIWRIDNDKGSATARFDLILYRTLEWKIASFFRCIGQKKHGEKVVMDWNKVVGARGKAHIKPRTYTKDGEERQVNDVDRFLDYDPSVAFTPVADDPDLPWGNGGF